MGVRAGAAMTLAALVGAAAVACTGLALAVRRWHVATALVLDRVHAGRPAPAALVSTSEIDALPAPVQRYFRAALGPGQRRIACARIAQRGTFLLRAPATWRPFDAVEDFAARPPGFLWDARIRALPAVAVLVRDALADGAGSTSASLMGVVSLASSAGPEVVAASLQRFLAEAVLLPTALLPGEGIAWSPIDDSSARAALRVGTTTVALDFTFGPDGLVRSVYTGARGREVRGRIVPTPWRGRWWEYQRHDGMAIPRAGEVEWILPEGPQLYWRGRMTELTYDYR